MQTFELPEVSRGEFLGDYQVIDVLGRGPMGTSYQVMSNVLQKSFTIKTLLLSDELSLSWLDRLEAQTALLTKLAHRNIDGVMSSGRSADLWYCVKDFIHDGEGHPCNLDQYRHQFGGKLSHFQTAHVVMQIVEGLRYAALYHDVHTRGVHHGNLKPENILVAFSSRPENHTSRDPFEIKISDFQPFALFNPITLAKLYCQWESSLVHRPTRVREKAIEQVLATVYKGYDYIAPELRQEGQPTAHGDIYGVGVLIYEMLTGSLPEGRFLRPTEIRPDIPEAWDTIVLSCLELRPDCRYHDYDDLLAALQALTLDKAEAPAPSSEVESTPTDKPRERLSLTPSGMVFIPAGTYFVGSSDCGQDALPQHEVESAGFYMDRNPVTNRNFAKFVEETNYLTLPERSEGAPIWISGEWRLIPGINWRNPMGQTLPDDFDDHPVTQIAHEDALAYCEWAGRRLPTEQEWEQAARGGLANVKFPWGDTISRVQANYSTEATTAIMSYQANGYGLYDMAGNVWEWTSSWYDAYPGNHQGSPHFGEQYRVVRGGAWMYDGSHCMVSYRNANDPTHTYPTVGFRTVIDFQCDLPTE